MGPTNTVESPNDGADTSPHTVLSIEFVSALNPIEISEHLLRLAQARGKVYSSNGFKQWSAHWRQWTGFCDRNGFARLPATLDSVVVYNAGLVSRSRDIGTAGNHRRTLALIHGLAGLKCPWNSSNEREIWNRALAIAHSQGQILTPEARSAPESATPGTASPPSDQASAELPEAHPIPGPQIGEILLMIEMVLIAIAGSATRMLSQGASQDFGVITALAHVILHAENARSSFSKVNTPRASTLPEPLRRKFQPFLKPDQILAEIDCSLTEVRFGLEAILEDHLVRDAASIRLIDAARSSMDFCLWRLQAAVNKQPASNSHPSEEVAAGPFDDTSAATLADLGVRLERLEHQWSQISAAFRVPTK